VNIIVVEDHEALREVTVSALQDMGHKVRGVACAEALNAELQNHHPHLLILDLTLPGEDGVSLARRVRKAHPEIGIIMVTARKELGDKLTGYDSGADLYLTKPTSIEELGAAIQALSRRLITWAKDSLQVTPDTRQLKSAERARAIHQQLINTKGKLPTIEELATQYACSARTLNDEFAAEYGQPIYPCLTEYRFKQAHAIIQHTSTPLKTLAENFGYTHVNHFNAAFRKKFGYAPGQLRKRRRAEDIAILNPP
jgi:DNA-binding response OmpR family regulator